MPDHLTPIQRHKNMAAIHGKNTKPEIIVRKYLWAHGFRYRLNHPRLPGKPDVVLRKYRTCVFVNGCFWHGHNLAVGEEFQEVSSSKFQEVSSSECCKVPKTNREFWLNKILRNKARDIEVQHKLAEMGWHSITIWECQLRNSGTQESRNLGNIKPDKSIREQTLESLVYTLNHIYLQDHSVHKVIPYSLPEEDNIGMAAEDLHK